MLLAKVAYSCVNCPLRLSTVLICPKQHVLKVTFLQPTPSGSAPKQLGLKRYSSESSIKPSHSPRINKLSPLANCWIASCTMVEHLVHKSLYVCVYAGTHVRSAATLGGNIALGRLKDLESDVITVFMAAGASVQVVSLSNNRSAHTLHKYRHSLLTGTFIQLPS